ncbi:MAG: transposase [Deltaproteobacteria bacterium]|nr:transposase [Deltaproteobacteria bacterium]
MDYLEFIVRVTLHIPDKGQVMVRYYGLYANAPREPAPAEAGER